MFYHFVRALKRFSATVICEWFWIGRLKPAGTLGSCAAIPPLMLLLHLYDTVALMAFAVISFILGCLAVRHYQTLHGQKDHTEIVIDEVCGMSIALFFLSSSWLEVGLAFVLFRLFDIAKPYPIHVIDRKVSGALGVMLDDVIAGLYAGAVGLALWPWVKQLIENLS